MTYGIYYGILWLHLHDWNCTRNPTTATTSDCISKGRDFNAQLGHLSRSQVFHMSNFDECLMFVGNAHLCSISQVSSHLQFLGQFPISHHIYYHIHSHPHDHSKFHQHHQHRITSFITNYHQFINILPNHDPCPAAMAIHLPGSTFGRRGSRSTRNSSSEVWAQMARPDPAPWLMGGDGHGILKYEICG